MHTMKQTVRKESVRCKVCGTINTFLYLSDFSYGQRLLLLDDGQHYALADLLQDNVWDEYYKTAEEIVKQSSVTYSDERLREFVNQTFGVTCDRINDQSVAAPQRQKRCSRCDALDWEPYLTEPEKTDVMAFPVVTHEGWRQLPSGEQRKIVF